MRNFDDGDNITKFKEDSVAAKKRKIKIDAAWIFFKFIMVTITASPENPSTPSPREDLFSGQPTSSTPYLWMMFVL